MTFEYDSNALNTFSSSLTSFGTDTGRAARYSTEWVAVADAQVGLFLAFHQEAKKVDEKIRDTLDQLRVLLQAAGSEIYNLNSHYRSLDSYNAGELDRMAAELEDASVPVAQQPSAQYVVPNRYDNPRDPVECLTPPTQARAADDMSELLVSNAWGLICGGMVDVFGWACSLVGCDNPIEEGVKHV